MEVFGVFDFTHEDILDLNGNPTGSKKKVYHN